MDEFDLEITFSGLCLFLVQAACTKVAVLQPDCRGFEGSLNPVHPDGDRRPGVYHAGYIQFSLANINSELAAIDPTGERYHGIHRFDREDLRFELAGEPDSLTVETNLPAVERIAPKRTPAGVLAKECGHGEESLLKPIAGLFEEKAPLVMRTVLSGGKWEGDGIANWVIPSVFNPSKPAHLGRFPRNVTWTRKVSGAEMTVSIERFSKAGSAPKLILRPVRDGDRLLPIRLKIANLCAVNPLGWGEFGGSKPDALDRDFKWLYRLLEPVSGKPIQDELNGLLLPIPVLTDSGAGVENCIGLMMNVASLASLGYTELR